MENRLLHAARSLFNGETIDRLAANEGLSSEQINQGLALGLPALFLGFQQQNEGALQGILDNFKSMFTSSNVEGNDITVPLDQPSSGFSAQVQGLVGQLFGGKLHLLVDKLSGLLGISGQSIQNILSAAVPAVISALTMNGVNWNANRISSELNEHKNELLSALPAGLSLGFLGTEVPDASHTLEATTEPLIKDEEVVVDPVRDVLITESVTPIERTPEPVYVEEEKRKGAGLWWILVPLLLLLLWFIFGKNFKNEDKAIPMDSLNSSVLTEIDSVDSAITLISPARETILVTLPNGTSLNAFKGGIEDKLVEFLKAGYASLSDEDLKNRWFDFDNLNFETNTANILPDSKIQVENIVEILKAFPEVKIKVGGYTDKTGDESHNKKLSNERAVAVKNALAENGVGNQVIDTEGYGSEFAKFEATAPESDRVQDRRVSVSVRK